MIAVRRLARRNYGKTRPTVLRVAAQCFQILVWPIAVLANTFEAVYRRPEDVRHAPHAMWAAIRHNVLPAEYLAYELWRPERRMHIDSFLYSHETPRLFRELNQESVGDPIRDKLAFFRLCVEAGIPTPTVYASIATNGELCDIAGPWSAQDRFFVKPRSLAGGFGTNSFKRTGLGYLDASGSSWRSEEIVPHLAKHATAINASLLLQEALGAHPDLSADSESAPAIVRLITGRHVNGMIVPIAALLYRPAQGAIVSQGGTTYLVDVQTGHVSLCPERQYADTLEGMWQSVVAISLRAHAAVQNYVFVGWDIAIADSGPVLLEGNANWGADEFQTLSGQPFGRTVFAAVVGDVLTHRTLKA